MEPLVVVSSDTHVGPLLTEQLRPYCPKRYLDGFDAYVADADRERAALAGFMSRTRLPEDEMARHARNLQTEGHHNIHARLRDLDFEGVAAEVIFHGSQNGEPIPFRSAKSFFGDPNENWALAAVGNHIYNEWLADMCSVEPERHVGLAHLPLWDVDAAVRELEWAREAGLRGVNFPAPRPGLVEYDDPVYEPFWSACEATEMPLTTHSGAGDPTTTGPHAVTLMALESGGWPSRRGLIRMIFGGVFERHPKLKLVLTEQPGEWWPYTMNELDSAYLSQHFMYDDQVPRKPSEYCMANVFIGASFLSRFEAEGAVRDGYASQVLWGSDYPHMEGTFQYPDGGDFTSAPSIGRLAMRFTFAGLPPDAIAAMVGQNAVRVYGLDGEALAALAEEIGAPTVEELSQPIDAVPEEGSKFAFRTVGAWG